MGHVRRATLVAAVAFSHSAWAPASACWHIPTNEVYVKAVKKHMRARTWKGRYVDDKWLEPDPAAEPTGP